MLKQLVDVASALLLVALTLGALFPAVRLATGRDPVRPGPRPVLWGALIGALGGLVMMIVHHHSIIRFDRQRLTLTTLEPTVFLAIVTLVVVWLYGRSTAAALAAGERILRPRHSRRVRAAVSIVAGAWAAMIVFRESQVVYMQTRTFVPATATVFSTETFLNVLGYLLGLVLVLVAAISVTRMCQLRPKATLPLLTFLAIALTLTHVFLIIRLLHAIRVIYLSPSAAQTMSWLINHEDGLIPIALAACATLAFVMWFEGKELKPAGENPAEVRTQRALATQMTRRSSLGLASYAIAAAIISVGARYATKEVTLSEPEPFDLTDSHAVIPLATIDDGHLHRFVYDTDAGVQVRWIVIQKAGSSYGVGLDACEICGPSGYYEEDGQVICKLCSVAMNIATIGFKGGCNPIPIDFEVANNTLAIPLTELENSAKVFA
ncbi:MAG: Fe-S-containing protein [Flaviflexus sp.]|nr:Fe-S-containing protein [Flaviflexus sp.]